MTNLNHTLTKSIVNLLSDTFIETTTPYQINHHLFSIINPVRRYLKYTSLSYSILYFNSPYHLHRIKEEYNKPNHLVGRFRDHNPDLLTLPL